MTDKINLQKLKKEYPEFFNEGPPPKLIELAGSEKTASQISEICLKNGIKDEGKIGEIAYHVASVLLGSLPLEVLPKALVTNSKIDTEIAEKISEEINQLIFSRVKDDLDKLYKKPSALLAKTPAKAGPPEEKAKRLPKKDIYREPVA